MRFLRTSVIVPAFIFLLLSTNLLHAADATISGRLNFENGRVACSQQCVVTLLVSGGRPVQTVLADFGGHFIFNNVPRGFYSVRIEIEGFETVTYPLERRDLGLELNVPVSLVRKGTGSTGRAEIVNVSQFPEQYPKKAVSLFEKGNDALKNKKQDEAVKYFKDAVELAPTFYEAHHQLGIAYRELGQFKDAEREFLMAHELNSTGIGPLINLTALYIDQNDIDQAVKMAGLAVKANAQSATAFFSFGFALYKADQLENAETALKRALDLEPKMGNAHLMLANVYLKLHRYNNTLEQLNSYIAVNPRGEQLSVAVQMRDRLTEAAAAEAAAAP